ncbi:MAG: FAD-dependent oxidoreductase [Clostridiales bacterium]|nr:FAD-dependent oxidoreductase [Clostridiales bacterium]
MDFKVLFSPIRIGNMEVPNRFVVPPMGTNLGNPDGTISQEMIDYWEARAKGGWGLIIVEVTAVDPLGKAIPFQPCLFDDSFIPSFKKLADTVHRYGTKIAVQLHHAGRQTSSQIMGEQPVAPSPVPCLVSKEMPRELSTGEVYEMIEKFGDAALRARKAGLDAIEVHGAHGYLIGQFMSPHSNKRVDEFGGSFHNRMRFPVEVVRNIRRKVGGAFPVIFRISGDERVTGGINIEESRAAARVLEDAGVDALHVSVGVYGSMQYIIPPADIPPGFLLPYSEEIKKAVSVPVIGVGRINHPALAKDAILSGKADLLSWGRQSLADPETPNKVAAGLIEDISPCIACNQGCVGYIFDPDKMKATCLVNPFCGREGKMKIEPAVKKKKLVIIGGGPGGLEAAWVAAARGHSVLLFEKESVPGGQFRVGAIAPAKQEITKSISFYTHMGRKYGVDFRFGVEAKAEQIIAEKPDVVIIATGAEASIPDIPGIDNPKVVTSTEILLGLKDPGTRVLVIGGGMVGSETADLLGEHGHEVTIAEMSPEIGRDVQESVRYFLFRRLKKYKTTIYTNTTVKEITNDSVRAEKDGEEIELRGFDTIVIAVGATSVNTLERELDGKVPELYVIGDASETRKAIDAIEEGASIAIRL